MTTQETISREQIETLRYTLKLPDYHHRGDTINALCDLAIKGLEAQPLIRQVPRQPISYSEPEGAAPEDRGECVLWCNTHNCPARECDPIDPDTGELIFVRNTENQNDKDCSSRIEISGESQRPHIFAKTTDAAGTLPADEVVERLKLGGPNALEVADEATALIQRLTTENERYKEALRWYANRENHEPTNNFGRKEPPVIHYDEGSRARAALAGEQTYQKDQKS